MDPLENKMNYLKGHSIKNILYKPLSTIRIHCLYVPLAAFVLLFVPQL